MGEPMTDEDQRKDTEIVTICGSMRFFSQMLELAAELTKQGAIVFAPFAVVPQDEQGGELKSLLDGLHLIKIAMSDRVIVVTDQHGYIGESTVRHMGYADAAGIPFQMREFDVPGRAEGGDHGAESR
jgi:hypothetical protein